MLVRNAQAVKEFDRGVGQRIGPIRHSAVHCAGRGGGGGQVQIDIRLLHALQAKAGTVIQTEQVLLDICHKDILLIIMVVFHPACAWDSQ